MIKFLETFLSKFQAEVASSASDTLTLFVCVKKYVSAWQTTDKLKSALNFVSKIRPRPSVRTKEVKDLILTSTANPVTYCVNLSYQTSLRGCWRWSQKYKSEWLLLNHRGHWFLCLCVFLFAASVTLWWQFSNRIRLQIHGDEYALQTSGDFVSVDVRRRKLLHGVD